jgi:hypothetical protein
MNSEKIIRINKVLRELNISLERGIAILKSGGFEIEASPNAKISGEQYQFLVTNLEQEIQETAMNLKITNHIVIDSIRKAKGIPATVFKYFGTNNNCIHSLGEKYLYHSHFTNFNDPFDCNGELINFEKKYKSRKERDTELFIKDRFSTIGICCFTRNVDSILMWSHYASNHKGFCVEYHYNSRINGINPLDVNYTESFTKADFYNDEIDALFHMIFTKAKQWEYEEELRSINSHFSTDDSRKVPFSKTDVKAVYLGVNCEATTRDKIVDIAKKIYDSKISVFQGELSDTAFEIVWKELKLNKNGNF